MTAAVPTPVHYLHTSTLIGGGNQVLLRLIDALDRRVYQPLSIVPRIGPMTDQLTRRRVPTLVLDLGGTSARHWRRAWTLGRLSLHLRRHGTAIVHANDPFTYGVSRRCWSPSSNRWICHIHHPDVDRQALAWSFRVPPVRILTPSRHVARVVSEALPDDLAWLRERVTPVMNPIDTAFFRPGGNRPELAARLRCDASSVHLVTAGAITAHKGQDLFVRIVRALRDRGRPVVGHVVGRVQPGSEAYEASVRALARELGVEAHVVFWGFAPDEDVRDLFRVADLFVLPTSEEGFGLVLAEAQACGTPVLATSIAPVDEVVRDGETGRLVPRTVEAFAEAADTLLADREGLERMGAAARSWVERTFGVESFCRNVTDVYEDVLAGGHGAAGEDRVRA